MTISQIPPGLILIAGGALLPFLGGYARQGALLLVPLVTLYWVWQIPDGVQLATGLLALERLFPAGADIAPGALDLVLVKGDAVGRLFATVFAFMAFGGGLFALKQKSTLELSAAFIYGGSAIGVAFAGDIITIFIFWEIMAVASTAVIWAGGTDAAFKASLRYLMIHLLGGVLLMAGAIDYILAAQTTAFGQEAIQSLLGLDRPGTWLILAGFLVNAGAPPLSAWLPDAYPESSYSGMVFLSAFTTKTAVLVLWRGYPGFDVLIFFGVYMALYGIIYALLENDMRRILAYSIVNQVGFMVTGIGIGGVMALNGAAAHAFTHIIYKALLLMSAGAVLYQTGKHKCTDLGGLFQTMRLTMVCGVVGALSISAFPLTSGFVSKSMISQGAADAHLAWVWFALTAASAGVFLHAGIKFPWYVFFQKDSGLRPSDPPLHMQTAMVLLALACIALGIFPQWLYEILPFQVDYVPYTVPHVVEMLQLLLFSGLAFFVMLPLMKRTLTISLDFDWFYRVFARAVTTEFSVQHDKARTNVLRNVLDQGGRVYAALFRYHGPDGAFARTLHVKDMALWVILLLGVYLLVSLIV